jgi:hypothetical protein
MSGCLVYQEGDFPMYASRTALPSMSELSAGLRDALSSADWPDGDIQVVDRRTNIHASSLPSEFITCQLQSGHRLGLFCKYTGDDFDECHGHRQDAGFEADVYRQFVNPLGVPAPKCFGSCQSGDNNTTWMFIEALPDVERVTEEADQARAMTLAAAEIGRFHRLTETTAVSQPRGPVRAHSPEFFAGWVNRTAQYTWPLRDEHPWLPKFCEYFATALEQLVRESGPIIHGEFYPHNILCHEGNVYFVDWQSAAIGAGEIDLASLVEGWSSDMEAMCRDAYVRARWSEKPPETFESTMQLAKLYWHFRWLGDRPGWTLGERSAWRLEHLRQAAALHGIA